VYTDAPVERVLVRNGAVCGVALVDGREIRTDTVVTAVHPRIGFLRHVEPGHLPDDFVRDIERWRSRSGTVKVNVAMDALPSFLADPGHVQQPLHTGAIDLSFSIDHLEQAFQDARTGRASEVPFADCVIPSTWDRTICPDGTHIMSMFTQWVPATWADEPDDAGLEAYADRVVDTFDQVAPGFKRSILHRQVIGPYEMEHEYGLIGGNIFHGELSPDQLFSNRPAPGYADYRSPIAGMYQAHSATHAGGGVTGIPGWQAAKAALADRASAERRAKLLRRKR
jgi:phytoene dehydrogenase-like protein